MNDYLLLMHGIGTEPKGGSSDAWALYLATLRAAGAFEGGSALGEGVRMVKRAEPHPVEGPVTGYIRIRAASLDAACALVAGNPVYEAGGTVEVRTLR